MKSPRVSTIVPSRSTIAASISGQRIAVTRCAPGRPVVRRGGGQCIRLSRGRDRPDRRAGPVVRLPVCFGHRARYPGRLTKRAPGCLNWRREHRRPAHPLCRRQRCPPRDDGPVDGGRGARDHARRERRRSLAAVCDLRFRPDRHRHQPARPLRHRSGARSARARTRGAGSSCVPVAIPRSASPSWARTCGLSASRSTSRTSTGSSAPPPRRPAPHVDDPYRKHGVRKIRAGLVARPHRVSKHAVETSNNRGAGSSRTRRSADCQTSFGDGPMPRSDGERRGSGAGGR